MRSAKSGRADRWIVLGTFKLSYQKIEGFAREQPQVFEKIVDKSNFEIEEKKLDSAPEDEYNESSALK